MMAQFHSDKNYCKFRCFAFFDRCIYIYVVFYRIYFQHVLLIPSPEYYSKHPQESMVDVGDLHLFETMFKFNTWGKGLKQFQQVIQSIYLK